MKIPVEYRERVRAVVLQGLAVLGQPRHVKNGAEADAWLRTLIEDEPVQPISDKFSEISLQAYWKDDPPVKTTEPIVLGFRSCDGCDTPRVCVSKGCGKEIRERAASYPECICTTEPTKCLRHNSFIDNRPRQIGAE